MNGLCDLEGCLIGAVWRAGRGDLFVSTNPSNGDTVWRGPAATAADVDEAVRAARAAFPAWSGRPAVERIAVLREGGRLLEREGDDLAAAISAEVGKPRWEARAEVDAMRGKIGSTLRAWEERQQDRVDVHENHVSATRYRPHGVLAVLGPFNFPGHIPQGHIVPALLAGNTVVFKPSEFAPLVGRRLVELWQRAGIPPGVLNLVPGGRDCGACLAAHPGHDGILFTGSYATGVALRRLLVAEPGRMLALELGGNNPLVVHEPGCIEAAVRITILSAFLTAGQRCTCARRLILPDSAAVPPFLDRLVEAVRRLRVGFPEDDPEPFCGPVIHGAAARHLLEAQDSLVARGGRPLAPMESTRGRLPLLSPGIIDVTDVSDRPDAEWFGPLLQVVRVGDFEAAIEEANRTAYGLAAALVCDDRSRYESFRRRVRAGLVNWNRPTTGASGSLPFGGVGHSGNHRPGGSFMIDSCAFPVASVESAALVAPEMPPGFEGPAGCGQRPGRDPRSGSPP
jgi:succinylglutamic semialdehyde dehydrogenase